MARDGLLQRTPIENIRKKEPLRGLFFYFIFTPLNVLPFRFIWSMKRPVFLLTFVQRLFRGESTCVRLFTSPFRPLPFLAFFAMSYHCICRQNRASGYPPFCHAVMKSG